MDLVAIVMMAAVVREGVLYRLIRLRVHCFVIRVCSDQALLASRRGHRRLIVTRLAAHPDWAVPGRVADFFGTVGR